MPPTIDLATFRDELAGFDFNDSRPTDAVADWVIGQLERGITHMTHPRYFGLFNPAPTFPAQCADRIVGAFNPQLATSTTSPAAVALEAHVIAAVARRAGLPPETTEAFHDRWCRGQLHRADLRTDLHQSRFRQEGRRAFTGDPVFYVSRASHLAWFKIAHQAGIGRDAVRLLATDGAGRLDAALSSAITADKATGPCAGDDCGHREHHQRRDDRPAARLRRDRPRCRHLVSR